MNDNHIKAFQDFIRHSEVDYYLKWQEARSFTISFYEQKAAELEVTVDYYLAEFV